MIKPLILMLFIAASASMSASGPTVSPRLLAKDRNDRVYPLKIQAVSADVRVVGNIAVTTLDMTFQNDSDRVLEGELVMSLSKDQVISRFAMDIGHDIIREGVVVNKITGRRTFESIVRRGIDPGLLEMANANTFRARVYPIPENGTKRIIIAYEQNMTENDDGMVYSLPLGFTDTLGKFTLTARVFGGFNKPEPSNSGINGLNFHEEGDGFVTHSEYTNFCANREFAFTIPSEGEDYVITEQINGKDYFLINLHQYIDQPEKKNPKTLCLLWDASASASGRDINKELSLLGEYFALVKNCTVSLVVFRNDVESPESFVIKNGNMTRLKDRLQSLDIDGGTQLGALDLNKYKCEEFLLFSDCLSNFGNGEIKLSNAPVTVIASAAERDEDYMRLISSSSSGRYIDLTVTGPREAAALMTRHEVYYLGADFDPEEISSVYPSKPQPLKKGFSLAGVLKSGQSSIVLNFGVNGTVSQKKTIHISRTGDSVKTGLMHRLWARHKLTDLMLEYEKNKDTITALGKEFSILTPNTSLIVLERISDYLMYRIKPPDNLTEEEREKYEKYRSRYAKDSIRQLEYLKEYENKTDYFSEYKKKIISDINIWLNFNCVLTPEDTSAKKLDIREKSLNRFLGIDTTRLFNTSIDYVYFDSGLRHFGTLTGRVIDNDGIPVMGAIVIVKGTRRGGFSKQHGQFKIYDIKPGNYTIKTSAVGFKAKEIHVSIENDCNTILETVLDESHINMSNIMVKSGATVKDNEITNNCLGGNNKNDGNNISENLSCDIKQFNQPVENKNRNIVFLDSIYSEETRMITGTENYYNNFLEQNNYNEIDINSILRTADFALVNGYPKLALRIISNLTEGNIEDFDKQSLDWIIAHWLNKSGFSSMAVSYFKHLNKINDDSYLFQHCSIDLANALANTGNYQEGADLLYDEVWDRNRFYLKNYYDCITDLNTIISKSNGNVDISRYNKSFIMDYPFQMKIRLDNNIGHNTDLIIVEPDKEICFYKTHNTLIGGVHINEFPNEYLINKPLKGRYRIIIYNPYWEDNSFVPVTVSLEVILYPGTPREQKKELLLHLKDNFRFIEVGEVNIE